MKWANKPSWGNTGSSWHVTIFDRIPDNYIGEVWNSLSKDILRLFPLPTIIMADFGIGTWHGNWINGYCIGVENRNCGYSGYKNLKNGLFDLGKPGTKIGNKVWEEFFNAQIVCNKNIGVLVQEIFGELDPFMILPHQCVWATKNDTGPLFPIHEIRDFVMSGFYLYFGGDFSYVYTVDEPDDTDIIFEDEPRVEVFDEEKVDIYRFGNDNIEECDFGSSVKLGNLGYFSAYTKSDLNRNVSMFQKSTLAYRKNRRRRKDVLKCSGVLDKNTIRVLDNRIRVLGY
jgi:hypothetical protein